MGTQGLKQHGRSDLAESQIDELLTKIAINISVNGTQVAVEASEAVNDLLLWVHYYHSIAKDSTARELLFGTRASAVESVAYLTLGLIRGALLAMRTQIDLILAYTYFSEHPVEWARLGRTGDGFMLKGEIVKYHKSVVERFEVRLKALEKAHNLSLDFVYRLLSAHVHGQSSLSIPRYSRVGDVSAEEPTMLASAVELQAQTTQALSMYLLALNASDWPNLPEQILGKLTAPLSRVQRSRLFSDLS